MVETAAVGGEVTRRHVASASMAFNFFVGCVEELEWKLDRLQSDPSTMRKNVVAAGYSLR